MCWVDPQPQEEFADTEKFTVQQKLHRESLRALGCQPTEGKQKGQQTLQKGREKKKFCRRESLGGSTHRLHAWLVYSGMTRRKQKTQVMGKTMQRRLFHPALRFPRLVETPRPSQEQSQRGPSKRERRRRRKLEEPEARY